MCRPTQGDVTQIKVPLRGLGPHNFYLSVRVRVAWSIEGSKNFRRRFMRRAYG